MHARKWCLIGLLLAVTVLGAATVAPTYYYDLVKNNVLVKLHLDIKGPTTSTSTLQVQGLSELYGVRAKPYRVSNLTQLSAVGGQSVFVIDPALGNEFRIDMPAIYASATGTTGAVFKKNLSGLTVVAGSAAPTASNDGYIFTITQWGDSADTPWTLWVAQTSGITPIYNLQASYWKGDPLGGTSQLVAASSVSDTPVYNQYDRKTYQYQYNSGVSIVPIAQYIRRYAEH